MLFLWYHAKHMVIWNAKSKTYIECTVKKQQLDN